MFKYVIRRLLLIIPTFLGVTFLVFFILQKAPDGPFDRAVKQLKNQQNNQGEVSSSSDVIGKSNELKPEVLEKLRAQYGLDKNIFVRYMIWLGIWPKETNVKEIKFSYDNDGNLSYNKYFRYKVEDFIISDIEKLLLQRHIHIEHKFVDENNNNKYDIGEKLIDENNNGKYDDFVISESGVGLEFPLEPASYFSNKDNFDRGKYTLWKKNYTELPNYSKIKTWYYSDYILKNDSQKSIYENYVDKNGNEQYDAEKFTDENGNGIWDKGEKFEDAVNGVYDEGEEFTDKNKNDKWDGEEKFVDRLNGIYDFEKFTDTNENGIWDKEAETITIYKKEYRGILTGYLGYSRDRGSDVSTLIYDRLPISLTFGLTSLIITYIVCIPLGIIKAVKNGSKFDISSSIVIFIAYSIPGYILGVLLITGIGLSGAEWPISGWHSTNYDTLSFLERLWDWIQHAILPVICYIIGGFAGMTVLMKNSLLENLSQDYVRTAFAKGLSEKRVIFFHAVRNSLIPLATGIGGMITIFLAGSYLIEKTFGIDGIGLLGLQALLNKDYDIIMGTVAITTVLGLLGNLLSDIVYAAVDPRIRFK